MAARKSSNVPSKVRSENWDTKLNRQARECLFVVIGRVTKILKNSHPDGKTQSIALIQVRRHLKGVSDVMNIEAEFRFNSRLHMTPDEEDVVWFIRGQLDNGRYLVTDWRWDLDSIDDTILPAINRADKKTRIPGMPKRGRRSWFTKPLSVSLAVDDGHGRALTTRKYQSLFDIKLLIEFENHGLFAHSVMPSLDGSISRRRYPHYYLEVVTEDGKVLPRQGFGGCGNINRLRTKDFISLQPKEVFRTSVPWTRYHLTSGKYRIRLHYTARRSLAADGILLGKNEKGTKSLIRKVWAGTLKSNWIEIEVLPKDKKGEIIKKG